jgi:hypothetical protein
VGIGVEEISSKPNGSFFGMDETAAGEGDDGEEKSKKSFVKAEATGATDYLRE